MCKMETWILTNKFHMLKAGVCVSEVILTKVEVSITPGTDYYITKTCDIVQIFIS